MSITIFFSTSKSGEAQAFDIDVISTFLMLTELTSFWMQCQFPLLSPLLAKILISYSFCH